MEDAAVDELRGPPERWCLPGDQFRQMLAPPFTGKFDGPWKPFKLESRFRAPREAGEAGGRGRRRGRSIGGSRAGDSEVGAKSGGGGRLGLRGRAAKKGRKDSEKDAGAGAAGLQQSVGRGSSNLSASQSQRHRGPMAT